MKEGTELYTFIAAQEIALIHFSNLSSVMIQVERDRLIGLKLDDKTIVKKIMEYEAEMNSWVKTNKELIATFVQNDEPIVTTFIDKFEYYLNKNIEI